MEDKWVSSGNDGLIGTWAKLPTDHFLFDRLEAHPVGSARDAANLPQLQDSFNQARGSSR